MKWAWLVICIFLFTGGVTFAGTLDEVRAKGILTVGANPGIAGFSMPDEKGVWIGLDIDTAKAIAAAVLGDANKVKYVPLTAVQRFPALQSKEVDVLCCNATITLTRETVNGLNFVHPNYNDGQGFLISKKKKFHPLDERSISISIEMCYEKVEYFRGLLT